MARQLDTESTLERETKLRLPENEMLLSFNSDEGATLFEEWWHAQGRATFENWAQSRPTDTEEDRDPST